MVYWGTSLRGSLSREDVRDPGGLRIVKGRAFAKLHENLYCASSLYILNSPPKPYNRMLIESDFQPFLKNSPVSAAPWGPGHHQMGGRARSSRPGCIGRKHLCHAASYAYCYNKSHCW